MKKKVLFIFLIPILLFNIVYASDKVTLTIDPNGGVFSHENIIEAEKGSTLKSILDSNNITNDLFSYDGKNYLGLSESANDNTIKDESFTIDEDTVLYAQWEDKEESNVTPEPNPNPEPVPEPEPIEPDVKVEISVNNEILSFGTIKNNEDVRPLSFIVENKGNKEVTLTVSYEGVENFYNMDLDTNIPLDVNVGLQGNISINKDVLSNATPGSYNGTFTIKATYEDKEYSKTITVTTTVETPTVTTPSIKVSYTTHVQNIGWQKYVSDGDMAGTIGKSYRLEAIKIKLENSPYSGNIEYKTHIQNIGWENGYRVDDQISGTSGKSYRLEAIEIKLNGEIAEHYDIYYRVHAENFGWLGWARNGERAGTAGYSYRLEAIEVRLFEKGTEFKEYGRSTIFYDKKNGSTKPTGDEKLVAYRTHVQNIGWQSYVYDGTMAGTTGRAYRLEGIKIRLTNQPYAGNIEYRTHIQNIGWESKFKSNDEMSGTSGKAYRLEAIEIKLTDEMREHYDVYYRVHAQNFGWLGWARNGERAGTAGYAYRLEGIEIKLLPKGEIFSQYGKSATFYEKGVGGTTPNADVSENVGWKTIDGKTYYYYEDGSMAKYLVKIDGIRYEFSKDGVLQHKNVKVVADVSYHDGTIDWEALWNSGEIDEVIFRIGWSLGLDKKFQEYLSEAKRLGIPYSVYHFSIAENGYEAGVEADKLITWYNDNELNTTMGVFYDLEPWNTTGHTSDTITVEDYDEIIEAYKTKLNDNGINMGVYASKSYAENRFSEYGRTQVTWIAQYNNQCYYQGSYRGWQFTATGVVPGVNGYVDLSLFYY
jgi:uncharacterized protein YjdB/GH25 family lysozyme M1 (1,4-beta-N-acetylmuramidase)